MMVAHLDPLELTWDASESCAQIGSPPCDQTLVQVALTSTNSQRLGEEFEENSVKETPVAAICKVQK